jgi:hypothetical protein
MENDAKRRGTQINSIIENTSGARWLSCNSDTNLYARVSSGMLQRLGSNFILVLLTSDLNSLFRQLVISTFQEILMEKGLSSLLTTKERALLLRW